MATFELVINGRNVKQPAEIVCNRYDLDSEDSFRSLSGEMQRDRVAVKVKLEC